MFAEARAREAVGRAALKPVIFGNDIDPRAIASARQNVEEAGLSDIIQFTIGDVALIAAPEQARGCVVCNPLMTSVWPPTKRCTATWAMP